MSLKISAKKHLGSACRRNLRERRTGSMVAADVCALNLAEMSQRIAARQLSSVDAVRSAISRLELVDSKLNAFITVIGEQALSEAEQADRDIAADRYRGPLHGVPVTIKDLFQTAGVLTTAGSK